MKFLNAICILLLIFGFSFFFCQAAQEEEMDLAKVRKAIEDVNLKFGEAFRQGDPAAVADFYTDDAVLLPPNSEIIKGKQSIEAFWSDVIAMGVKDVNLTTVEVMPMGDMACEIGKYSLTIQPEGLEEAIGDNGKFLVIWKQTEDGSWKLHIDIWNTSMPVQQ